MKKIQFQALELDFFFCYVLLLLQLECFLDHVYRVEELPAEELDEFWDELAFLSYHDSCLVWVTTNVTV